ncbi:MAG: LysR family transcriptional regulator [Hyphomicrobiales bacterium]|nr:LysR family transcriptional regulator [Hyphomicrobiales bacterium]
MAEPRISTKQLRYFSAIMKAGSFSGAARVLNVSQPALGQQIRDLEARLGVELLTRTPRGIEATEAGDVFLVHASSILEALRRAEHSVAPFRATVPLELVIGVTPTIGRALVDDLLQPATYGRREVKISLLEGLSTDLLQALREGEIQAAICYDAAVTPTFDVTVLFQEDLVLVGRPDQVTRASVRVSDLPMFPLALGTRQDGGRDAIERAALEHRAVLDVRTEIAHIALKRELLIRQQVCTIVPYGSFFADISSGRLNAADIEPPIRRDMTLVLSHDLPEVLRAKISERVQIAIRTQLASGALKRRLKSDATVPGTA